MYLKGFVHPLNRIGIGLLRLRLPDKLVTDAHANSTSDFWRAAPLPRQRIHVRTITRSRLGNFLMKPVRISLLPIKNTVLFTPIEHTRARTHTHTHTHTHAHTHTNFIDFQSRQVFCLGDRLLLSAQLLKHAGTDTHLSDHSRNIVWNRNNAMLGSLANSGHLQIRECHWLSRSDIRISWCCYLCICLQQLLGARVQADAETLNQKAVVVLYLAEMKLYLVCVPESGLFRAWSFLSNVLNVSISISIYIFRHCMVINSTHYIPW